MMRHLASRMHHREGEAPMWQMALLAAFLSAIIVVSVHYLV